MAYRNGVPFPLRTRAPTRAPTPPGKRNQGARSSHCVPTTFGDVKFSRRSGLSFFLFKSWPKYVLADRHVQDVA